MVIEQNWPVTQILASLTLTLPSTTYGSQSRLGNFRYAYSILPSIPPCSKKSWNLGLIYKQFTFSIEKSLIALMSLM